MGKSLIKIILLISISLNIALAVNFFTSPGDARVTLPVLNLNQTQKKQFSQIQEKQHQANQTLKREISTCQQQMIKLLKADSINKSEVNTCIEKISTLQKQLQQNTIDEIIRLKQVLDPNQCSCLLDSLNSGMQRGNTTCTKSCCSPQN